MAKWAFITVLLYICLVVIIFVPLVWWVAFYGTFNASDVLETFTVWQFWLVCGIITAIQALMLLFPVKTVAEAPKPQRLIWVPIVTAALLFSILVLGVVWSILMAIWGDDILGDYFDWASLAFVIFCWIVWLFVFYRFYRDVEAKTLFQRITTWLIRGSIVELLVAVPSHIIVRRRDECSAPGVTYFGIAAGLVIMAVAFGPGLYFLFLQRFERMKPRSKRKNHQLSNQ
ncbi:MAG: hypothetical protein NTX52_11600 [Planctomycetota bacterium]|nr:hypothetical protein [Planctomycetota bacterium]